MRLLTFLVDRKELLTLVFFVTLFVAYGAIYVLVEEKYESTATIIPKGEEEMAGLGALLRGMKGVPFGLGGKTAGTETDLYTTILESRTLLERIVQEFQLYREYDIDTTVLGYMEMAVGALRKNITTKLTDESAFLISVRSNTREGSAAMTNAVIREMNDMIIELKVSSSRENRQFLENRVHDIQVQLRMSEDSLKVFQERTGFLEIKSQVEGILSVHTLLESELAARELQRGILLRQFDLQSPQVRDIDIQIGEYRKKLEDMRSAGTTGGVMVGLKQLPQTGAEYIRRYRDVQINHLLLEFIVPMYEQSKIDEKKDYPILQVIDKAVPPAKRAWPPRTMLAASCSLSVVLILFVVLYVRSRLSTAEDPRIKGLFEKARRWSFRIAKED